MFQRYEVVYVPLSKTEIYILQVVTELEALTGKAHTQDVAAAISLSYHQALRYLKHMEASGKVRRIGQRGGWKRIA